MKKTGNQPMSCTVEIVPVGCRFRIPRIRLPMTKTTACGDNLVKRVLEEAPKPTPEEPLKFRHDKERNEYRADKNTDSRGDKSVSDDDDGNCLCCGKQNYDNGVDDGPENVGYAG